MNVMTTAQVTLVSLRAFKNIDIISAIFPYNDIHNDTWKTPNGKNIKKIDHVHVDKQHISNLIDFMSYNRANLDFDHYLFIAKLRGRIFLNYQEMNTYQNN